MGLLSVFYYLYFVEKNNMVIFGTTRSNHCHHHYHHTIMYHRAILNLGPAGHPFFSMLADLGATCTYPYSMDQFAFAKRVWKDGSVLPSTTNCSVLPKRYQIVRFRYVAHQIAGTKLFGFQKRYFALEGR